MRFLKKIPVHPSFLLLVLWFVITRNFLGFFIFVGVVLSHEFGHYFVAKKLGYKLDSFFLAPYGVSLNYKDCNFSPQDEIKIAVAGPVVNLALALIAVSIWWIFPVTYGYTCDFVAQSLFLALFNLLPAYPMDGGRIFVGALSHLLSRKKAIKIISILNIIFSLLFFLLFVVSCCIDFNPSFALASCFMLGGLIQGKFESKYEKINAFKKGVKNFSKPAVLVIKSSVKLSEAIAHIEVNKHTIFYVVGENKTKLIDEKTLLKWSMIYPLELSFDEIIKF